MLDHTQSTSTYTSDSFDGTFSGTNPKFLEEIRQRVEALIYQATGSKHVILAHTLIVDFLEGDHNAAILLNQILYWLSRTADKEGWFYKTYDDWYNEIRFSSYQVWRVVRGDPRVEKFKRTLWSIGLETEVRMAPNGRNAVYYRLNEEAFFTEFTIWLQQRLGNQPVVEQAPVPTKPVSPFFYAYETHFGRITVRIKNTLSDYEKTLGEPAMKSVLDRCINRATHWNYVISALANAMVEQVSPKPQPQYTNNHDNTEFATWWTTPQPEVEVSAKITQIEKDYWRQTCVQLQLQMGDRDYNTYIRDLVLVDLFNNGDRLEYWFVAQTPQQIKQLTYRIGKLVRRLLSDFTRQAIDVRFILYDEWQTKPPA